MNKYKICGYGLILLVLLSGCTKIMKDRVIGSGVFDRVEYKTGGFMSSDLMIIYYQDGSTTLIKRDIFAVSCKKGETIEIYCSGPGKMRLRHGIKGGIR